MSLPTPTFCGLCYACCYFNTNVQQMPSGARKAPDGRDLHFRTTFSFTNHTDALLFQKLSQNSRSPTTHVLRQKSLGSRIASKSIDQQKSNYPFVADLQDLPPLPCHMSRILIRYPALPSSTFPNLADPKAPAVTPASRQRSTANKPDPNQPCRSMQVHLPFAMIIL